MSNLDDATRLRHMRDAAIEARNFIENRIRTDLDSDRMLALALVKDVEIIGEAASRISATCKAKYPQIP
ncbi:MAG TPA: HepT-like ribonuclease domain-containing protein [Coleofasciculaceae cyanobacterium]